MNDSRTTEIDTTGLTIGSGYFGKKFEVRPGMEKEAKAMRKE